MLKIWSGPWLRLRRIRDAKLTNITNRREKRDNSHSPIYDFRACERLAHCANAKNIECEATYLVHPCTPRLGGTPLENPGTPWGVQYTRLTSTALKCISSSINATPIDVNYNIKSTILTFLRFWLEKTIKYRKLPNVKIYQLTFL